MEDKKIVELYWARSETAIAETSKKYSGYCYKISYNILNNSEDAEECTNDTYLKAWNVMPPKKPDRLTAFLGAITRNLSINKFKLYSAQKRGGAQTELALSELEDCVFEATSITEIIEDKAITNAINSFLSSLSKENRIIFVRRYWYLCSIADISKQLSMSESKIKSLMFSMRKKLKLQLEKEGIAL